MGMSDLYGQADEKESIATIQAAIDAGITLLDTGDYYGAGANEMLIRKAIEGKRDKLFIQIKYGALRDPKGAWLGFDTRPVPTKNFLAMSLRRLNTDYIDLYQPGRIAPHIPTEETIGGIAELVKEGYVKNIGLSEAGAATIRKAQAVHPISSLQIEYSLISRSIEKEILPTTRELNISLTVYGVLSRGLLSGKWTAERAASGGRDYRAYLPRFTGVNLTRNLNLVETLTHVGAEYGATPSQVAIAWVLHRGDDIIPLIGARSRAQLHEALKALDIKLDSTHVEKIEQAIPADSASGTRYDEQHMNFLDSEK